jgi:hypothetical protein
VTWFTRNSQWREASSGFFFRPLCTNIVVTILRPIMRRSLDSKRFFVAYFHNCIMRRLLDSKLVTSDQYIARHSLTILHGVPSLSSLPLENTWLSIVPPIRKGKLQLAIMSGRPGQSALVEGDRLRIPADEYQR